MTKLTERIEEIQNDEQQKIYRVILLDYSMPVMDGLETAKEIRQLLHRHEAYQPYIVCCSAYDEDNFKEEAYAAGMDDFFTKPVNANELMDTVKAVLRVWWMYDLLLALIRLKNQNSTSIQIYK